MWKSFEKLLSYTTPHSIRLLLVAYVALFLATIAIVFTGSTELFAGLVALSIMLWWPITRDLTPVCWGVVVNGRWPDGTTIRKAL